MTKISHIEIFKANIPFKISFKHALRSRKESESIFVKIVCDNRITGFGEALPRPYVTGNTQDSEFTKLKDYLPTLLGAELRALEEGINFIRDLKGIEGEARCALEIALLDCMGKISERPLCEILGAPVDQKLPYSAIISDGPVLKTLAATLYFLAKGFKFFKVKVGTNNDVERVRLVRRLAKYADIRVDANGAWDAKDALKAIEKLRPFNISGVEQPTPKGDFDAMQEVADLCHEPIIADESLCTKEDALRLALMRACDIFNVRLSKCGGIFRSLEIIKIAEEHEIGYQIGCHVGESGLLTAAAMHLGATLRNIKYFEGGYSRLLLKEDIIKENLTLGKESRYTLKGKGLGVTVKENALKKYSLDRFLIS